MPTTPNRALRARRVRADLTVRALADLAGVSRSTITRIENGSRYGNGTLITLAEALGCEPTELGWTAA